MTAAVAGTELYVGRHRRVLPRAQTRTIPPLLLGAVWLVGAGLLVAAAAAVLFSSYAFFALEAAGQSLP